MFQLERERQIPSLEIFVGSAVVLGDGDGGDEDGGDGDDGGGGDGGGDGVEVAEFLAHVVGEVVTGIGSVGKEIVLSLAVVRALSQKLVWAGYEEPHSP